MVGILQDFSQEISWVEPEILNLSEELFNSYLEDELLNDYKIYLKSIDLYI